VRRAAKRFINHIKTERGLSPETVESYRDDLKKFIEYAEAKKGRGLLPGDIRPEVMQEFIDFLGTTGYRKKERTCVTRQTAFHHPDVLPIPVS
jgi:site-specific recombinase XerD